MSLPRLGVHAERHSHLLDVCENALEQSQPWPNGLSEEYLERHGLEGCLQHIIGCDPTSLTNDIDNAHIGWVDIIRDVVLERKSDESFHCYFNEKHFELDQHIYKKIKDGRNFLANIERISLATEACDEMIHREIQAITRCMPPPPPPDAEKLVI